MTTFAILIWPLMALILFAQLPVLQALIWSVLLPYMFLPEAFDIDLPGIPPLSKTNMIAVGLVLAFLVFRKKITTWASSSETFGQARPALKWVVLSCVIIAISGSVMTVFTNTEALIYGDQILPPARPRDVVSVAGDLVFRIVPFFFALFFLTTERRHHALLVALVMAGLVYSVLMAVEIRLSPQLHKWIYGYYQHSFVQHVRDGFRPMVFMQHGLWVSFFAFTAIIAALGLWRSTKEGKWLAAAAWIFLVLALSSNLGALIIATGLGAAFVLLPRRLLLWFIASIAMLVFLFPAVRASNVLPLDGLLNFASSIDQRRAESLQYRFDNEDILLEKAQEKPVFGWGGWNRNRVFTERGQEISTTDGLWIIIIGQYGWVGYLSNFGLLVFPLLFLIAARRQKEVPIETLALGMISAGNLIYIIPNATLTPAGFLIFGAVAGYAIYGAANAPAADTEEQAEHLETRRRRQPRFTRGGQKHIRRPLAEPSQRV